MSRKHRVCAWWPGEGTPDEFGTVFRTKREAREFARTLVNQLGYASAMVTDQSGERCREFFENPAFAKEPF